jgi:hypothetical protein
VSAIFISYRREDSAGYAGRICERLSSRYGAENVFMDVQDIAPGDDFADAIEKRVSECNALVAMIGPRWLSSIQARRPDEDFVRHEIAVALRRGVKVIPVLVGGAGMPQTRDLPDPLAPLARHQAVTLRDDRFDDDLAVLERAIPGRRSLLLHRVVVAAAVVAIAVLGWLFLRPSQADLSGQWTAAMTRTGFPPYRVDFDFTQTGARLAGTVRYPTGDGVIEEGSVNRGHVAFTTLHVPQFESEPARIRFEGTLRRGELELLLTSNTGVARGIAHRR